MAEHEYYMGLALKEAEKALAAGEFPVGCVLVQADKVLALGRRLHSGDVKANELDHAEIIALRSLWSRHPRLALGTVTVYVTMEPCLMCLAAMLLSGLRVFIWGYEDVMGGGMNLDLRSLSPLYRDMKITRKGGIMRSECLQLFQEYFRNYSYWQNSLLATYTLAQKL